MTRTFDVLVYQRPNGSFFGKVPALEGCTAEGRSKAELLSATLDAIRRRLAHPDPEMRRIKDILITQVLVGVSDSERSTA